MDAETARDALHAERARLEADLDRLRAGIPDGGRDSADRLGAGADDPVETYADELDEGMEEDLRASLDEVDEALARVGAGTYGICVDCGAEIPANRLAALPASARCTECQRKAEHR